MDFRRQQGLGCYNSGRSEWLEAYRNARVQASQGLGPDAANDGVRWKAELIVRDRAITDELAVPVANRLSVERLIEEVLNDEVRESGQLEVN